MKTTVSLLVFAACWVLPAQEETRNFVFNGWGRPGPQASPGDAVVKPYRHVPAVNTPRAKTGKSRSGPVRAESGAALGITVWKLDVPAASDPVRLLVLEGSGAGAEFTPRRVEAGELLRIGDRVRLSVESPRAGFLYVVDEEIHADGTFGPPYLIFPLAATRNGDNRVNPGQLVEIPDQMDPVNVFTIRAKGPSDCGERLTFIVSPKPLGGIELTRREQRLPDALFRTWFRQVDSRAEHFELVAGKGSSWTKAEQQAGADRKRLLTLADPVPQTVFLFPSVGDKPILARVLLKFAQ